MSSGAFKNYAIYKLLTYKLYIYIYIYNYRVWKQNME